MSEMLGPMLGLTCKKIFFICIIKNVTYCKKSTKKMYWITTKTFSVRSQVDICTRT